MAMTARLLGISALAVELNRDRRTVAGALRRTPADGKSTSGVKTWFVSTALRALEHAEGGRNHRTGVFEDDLAALEDAARRVDEALSKLKKVPNVEQRRRLVRAGVGRCVGEFIEALERVRASHSPEQRIVEQPFLDDLTGALIGEVLALCSWKLLS